MTRYLLAVTFVFVTLLSQAQAPTTTGGGVLLDPPTPTEVPLDGGASLLLASGVAYGLKRLRARKA